MDFLAQVPKNYVGALQRPFPSGIDGGHWCFDTGTRVLVYQVRNGERLKGGRAIQPGYSGRCTCSTRIEIATGFWIVELKRL
jgi:hypothetical protein